MLATSARCTESIDTQIRFVDIDFFQFIGFQYSAYISGEIRGNVKRGVLVAVIGALGMAVLMNTIYPDILARKLGLDAQTAWAAAFWGYISDPALPMGQPNYFQLVGAIAQPDLWPIWTIVGAASTLFPFLLMPVYVIFLSRMALAWSLDRQVPEWFGTVSERLRAPANAIFAALTAHAHRDVTHANQLPDRYREYFFAPALALLHGICSMRGDTVCSPSNVPRLLMAALPRTPLAATAARAPSALRRPPSGMRNRMRSARPRVTEPKKRWPLSTISELENVSGRTSARAKEAGKTPAQATPAARLNMSRRDKMTEGFDTLITLAPIHGLSSCL